MSARCQLPTYKTYTQKELLQDDNIKTDADTIKIIQEIIEKSIYANFYLDVQSCNLPNPLTCTLRYMINDTNNLRKELNIRDHKILQKEKIIKMKNKEIQKIKSK